jgi:hypothetical protein
MGIKLGFLVRYNSGLILCWIWCTLGVGVLCALFWSRGGVGGWGDFHHCYSIAPTSDYTCD